MPAVDPNPKPGPLDEWISPRSGRYADLGRVVRHLRERGWSDERLAKNDLALPSGAPGTREKYETFWRTLERLAAELEAQGLPPIFIKCVREYEYCDSNVDVLVPRARLRSVARHLYRTAWSPPTVWDSVEQLLIERAKLKLPARETGLCAAHLYGGVSWRYQSDMGLLRRDGREADPAQLERVAIDRIVVSPKAQSGSGSREIWLPSDAAEFVLQAAHVAFENYRITVGEAIHFRLLRERAGEAWEEAQRLGATVGCTSALALIDRESLDTCTRLAELRPEDYPRTLPMKVLWPALRERALWHRGQGRPVAAAAELSTAAGVYGLVSNLRRFRRFRRGVEDYR